MTEAYDTDQSNKSQELSVPSPESLTLAEQRQRLAERLGRILARYWLANRTLPETTITAASQNAGRVKRTLTEEQ